MKIVERQDAEIVMADTRGISWPFHPIADPEIRGMKLWWRFSREPILSRKYFPQQ
jgi:hypothetical protein